MTRSRRRKSPQARLMGFKAEFRKTSEDGARHEPGTPPRHAKFFTFDNRNKDNVILRRGFTPEKVLAAIGGEPIHKHVPDARQATQDRDIDKRFRRDVRKAKGKVRIVPRNTDDSRENIERNLAGLLRDHKGEWYQTEKNTALLLSTILSSLNINKLSGDDIWNLLRLTWITLSKRRPARDYWKRLKVPALAALFEQEGTVLVDFKTTLEAMQLPAAVAQRFRKGRRGE
jgi:hypothetical protein